MSVSGGGTLSLHIHTEPHHALHGTVVHATNLNHTTHQQLVTSYVLFGKRGCSGVLVAANPSPLSSHAVRWSQSLSPLEQVDELGSS